MIKPLVSVIVPTYNSAETLGACLQSIRDQTYPNIELVVVDNHSTDNTLNIAKTFTKFTFTKGPERSAQRNYGVSKAKGEFVLIIDSDMELAAMVVEECVDEFTKDYSVTGLVIPEESFGIGFWAQCKKLERSFYVGVAWMEAARAFHRESYVKAGGYDESMVSGEDWDFSQRVAEAGKLGRIDAYIMHNEGRLKLGTTLRKKYYYARKFAAYTRKEHSSSHVNLQTGVFTRYKLFFNSPSMLFKNPVVGVGMLVMKTCEFGMGAIGLLFVRLKT